MDEKDIKFILNVIEKYRNKEITAKTALFRIYGCVSIALKEVERKESNENS
jgi:hypothetical protein